MSVTEVPVEKPKRPAIVYQAPARAGGVTSGPPKLKLFFTERKRDRSSLSTSKELAVGSMGSTLRDGSDEGNKSKELRLSVQSAVELQSSWREENKLELHGDMNSESLDKNGQVKSTSVADQSMIRTAVEEAVLSVMKQYGASARSATGSSTGSDHSYLGALIAKTQTPMVESPVSPAIIVAGQQRMMQHEFQTVQPVSTMPELQEQDDPFAALLSEPQQSPLVFKMPEDRTMRPRLQEAAPTGLMGWNEATLIGTGALLFPDLFYSASQGMDIYSEAFWFPKPATVDQVLGYLAVGEYVEQLCSAFTQIGHTINELQSMPTHSGDLQAQTMTYKKQAYVTGLIAYLRRALPQTTALFVEMAQVLQVMAIDPLLARSLRGKLAQHIKLKYTDHMRELQIKNYDLDLPEGLGVCDEAVKQLRLAVGAFREAKTAMQHFTLMGGPFKEDFSHAKETAPAPRANDPLHDPKRQAVLEVLHKRKGWKVFITRAKESVKHARMAECWAGDRLQTAVDERIMHALTYTPAAREDTERTFIMALPL